VYASVIPFPKVANPRLAIHLEVRYFNSRSVATLHSKKGVGSKSMDTKASFIGQMSDSISRLIFLKNFYDHRYTILNYGCWHNLSGEGAYSIAIILQERLHAMKQTSNEKSEQNQDTNEKA
jgi:hypothetical protein